MPEEGPRTQEDDGPLFAVGDNVLTYTIMLPGKGEPHWMHGVITEYKGKRHIYEGRGSQDESFFQHHYDIDLIRGGHVPNCESRMRPDPRFVPKNIKDKIKDQVKR